MRLRDLHLGQYRLCARMNWGQADLSGCPFCDVRRPSADHRSLGSVPDVADQRVLRQEPS